MIGVVGLRYRLGRIPPGQARRELRVECPDCATRSRKIVIKFAIGLTVVGNRMCLKPPTPEEREQLASAGMAWGMGCSIVVSILISILGGILIDRIADMTPVFTLIGVGLGMFLAGYQLWELVQLSSKSARVGPVARQVARVPSRSKSRSQTER